MASSDVPVAASAPVTTSTRPLRVVVVRPDERVDAVVARHPGASPSFNRTLRVALAMRGGVSLAVWIGGVVSELDLLRRIRLYDVDGETLALVPVTPGSPPSPATLARLETYARMLDAAGYDRVEFDLLAGASAGGLNAVVYAVARRAGTGLERLLETWGRVGGFWGLLHPPGSRGILALMQGEGYFRSQTLRTLTEIYDTDDRHPDLVASYTGVDLSATVIDGGDEFEEGAHEGRGHFHFVGSDEHRLDNLVPSRADDDPEQRAFDLANLDRLALAARSTSSLPGGFEPAYVDSYNGAVVDLDARPATADAAADGGDAGDAGAASAEPALRSMGFAFASHREQPGTPYRIVDGAVFDNVPIDRALRAARTRSSERRADRAMLFLDPEPDPPLGGTVGWDANASRFFRAIGAMLSRQFRKESVSREVADLEEFNAERSVAAARLQGAAPLVAAALAAPDTSDERTRVYVRSLGPIVADHLAEAISAPSLWQLNTLLPERRRYRPIERVELAGLTQAAMRRFALEAERHPAASARSITALADAANCVLGWTRAVESVPERGSRRGLAFPDVREVAYASLRFATDARDRLTASVLLRSDAVAARRETPRTEDFDAWIDTWVTGVARVRTAEYWAKLDLAVAQLRLASRRVEQEIADGLVTAPNWSASAWRPLAAAPASLTAADLPPLYHSSGIPPALSHVRYWAIGVDEEPDAPSSFSTLATDRWHALLQAALRRPGTSPADVAELVRTASSRVVIDRQTKLAGYGFGNFLGFLSREWRINDWWWGRLDAAAGLARFFDALAPDEIDVDAAIHVLQDAALEDADRPETHAGGLSPLDEPRESDAAATRRTRLRAGTDTIVNLAPSYRFAIASRTVRLLDRVIVQPVSLMMGIVAYTLLAVLRPVLVLVPTLLDPPRLALVSGFIAAVLWLLTWAPVGVTGAAVWVAIVTVFAFLGILVGGIVWARGRWSAVASLLDGPIADDVAAASGRAWGPTLRMAAAALASLIPLTISIVEVNVGMAVVCWIVSVVLTALAVRAATTVRRGSIPGRDLRTGLLVGAFGLLGGVLPLLQILFAGQVPWLAPPEAWNPVVLAIGAAAVTVSLTVDWLRPGRTPREIAATHGVNWITVSLLAVGAGAVGLLLMRGFVSALGAALPDLVGEVLLAIGFILAWANALWWLPELRRHLPDANDRVQRAPLG
ncbi:DUF3376 domain-containing protein [Agromyces tardus]|uniref:DUF3376 domain-containing protein n=1 Tax=Agromyces tardus TaxID=2583849 RepID=A0A3M8A605_9MICO|nr:DUF3376 domain-containing protein [Agromyces tardus]RNB45975.1 DUF3376 domain-containing protein [Agromyces tardus]